MSSTLLYSVSLGEQRNRNINNINNHVGQLTNVCLYSQLIWGALEGPDYQGAYIRNRWTCRIAPSAHYLPESSKVLPHFTTLPQCLVVSGNKVCSSSNFIILSRPKDGRCTEEGGSINNKLIYFCIYHFLYFSIFIFLCSLYFHISDFSSLTDWMMVNCTDEGSSSPQILFK